MTKIVCFSGTHCTGKTTLAKTLAEKMNGVYVPANISDTHKAFGVSPSEALTLDMRLKLQYALYDRFSALLEEVRKQSTSEYVFIDRSPLCLASYLMCDIGLSSEYTKEQDEQIMMYYFKCIDLCTQECDYVFHLSPVGVFEAASTRGPIVMSYMTHQNLVLKGMFEGLSQTNDVAPGPQYYTVPFSTINLREEYVTDVLNQT